MEVDIKDETPMEEGIHISSDEATESQPKIKTESIVSHAEVEDFNLQRSDRVKAALATYFKRRNYKYKASSNGDVQLVKKLCVDAKEARELTIVRAAVSNRNAVKYSPSNIDSTTLIQVDIQLTKLLQLIINIKNDTVKRELLFIIPILFAHIYIELLQGVKRKAALIFLKKHFNAISEVGSCDIDFPKNFFKMQGNTALVETFDKHSSFREWLNEVVLELMGCIREVDSHSMPILMLFRSMKQKVSISTESSIFLTEYLSKNAHILILHVLKRWFKYELKSDTEHLKNSTRNVEENETDNPELLAAEGVPVLAPSSSTSTESNYLSSNIAVNDDVLELVETIHELTSIEKMAITNLLNAKQVSCAASNTVTLTKAFGFTNSDILVCNNHEEMQVDLDFETISDNNPFGYSWIRNSGKSLQGHRREITDLLFTRTDPYLLTASRDTTVKLWKLTTGCEVATYRAHHNPVWCVDISPNDFYFGSGSQDCVARLWAFDRSNTIRTFAGHISDIECIKFHLNQRYVATGSKDTTVRMFSIFDGNAVRLFNGKGGSISAIAFSPDGKLLAAAGEDTYIQIWDIGMCRRLHLLPGHTGHIVSLAWDPSEQGRLISGTMNGEVKIWVCEGGNKWSVASPYHKTFRRILNIDFVQEKNMCIGNIYAIPRKSIYNRS